MSAIGKGATAFSRRLVVRIYLSSLALVLVASFALDTVRRHVIEPSQQRGTLQLARLVGSLAAEAWGSDEALHREVSRLRSVLDADVTVFLPDGAVRATNRAASAAPLPPEKVRELLSRDEVELLPPRTAAVPIDVDGVPRGYLLITPRAIEVGFEVSLLTIGIMVALVGAFSFVMARLIATPLAKLTEVARRFGTGDLGARAHLRRKDELGELGRAFDDMAERIAHLVRAQKELLANVSHELRTPLSRLRVALDLAIERGDERRMELLTRNVQDNLAELEKLLTGVLTAARLDLAADRATGTPLPFTKRTVLVEEILNAARERFATAHPDRPLRFEAEPGLPEVEADPVMLRRALDNVLDNADRYSDRGIPVSLRACRAGASVMIDVVDQGVGISPEDLPHVFEPFFRADRSRSRAKGGVGLGLVLAQRIVEAHGGSISVESEVDRGTVMRIILPATA